MPWNRFQKELLHGFERTIMYFIWSWTFLLLIASQPFFLSLSLALSNQYNLPNVCFLTLVPRLTPTSGGLHLDSITERAFCHRTLWMIERYISVFPNRLGKKTSTPPALGRVKNCSWSLGCSDMKKAFNQEGAVLTTAPSDRDTRREVRRAFPRCTQERKFGTVDWQANFLPFVFTTSHRGKRYQPSSSYTSYSNPCIQTNWKMKNYKLNTTTKS